jgi:hypothetical protein
MNETELISKLLPSIPELDELLRRIREKYNIPEVLPEDEQLASILVKRES